MRTEPLQTFVGQINSVGVTLNGPMSCNQEATGRYRLYAPPGKRIVGIVITGVSFPAWSMVQVVQIKSESVLVIFANENGTVENNAGFFYNVSLAG